MGRMGLQGAVRGRRRWRDLLWFWVSVILCIVPLLVSWSAEKKAEERHGK